MAAAPVRKEESAPRRDMICCSSLDEAFSWVAAALLRTGVAGLAVNALVPVMARRARRIAFIVEKCGVHTMPSLMRIMIKVQ